MLFTSRLLGAVTMSSVKHAVHWGPNHGRTEDAPKPPARAGSVSRSQCNPTRNCCRSFAQVISSGNDILSCCDTHRAWWGRRWAPQVSPGTPCWLHGPGSAWGGCACKTWALSPPEPAPVELQPGDTPGNINTVEKGIGAVQGCHTRDIPWSLTWKGSAPSIKLACPH